VQRELIEALFIECFARGKPLLDGWKLFKEIRVALEGLDLLNHIGCETPLEVMHETLVKIGAEHVAVLDEGQIAEVHSL
jgi:hypothetical protein